MLRTHGLTVSLCSYLVRKVHTTATFFLVDTIWVVTAFAVLILLVFGMGVVRMIIA